MSQGQGHIILQAQLATKGKSGLCDPEQLIQVSFPCVNLPVFSNHAKNIPGPGQYEPKATISRNGSYFNSKYTSSKCTTFNPPHSKRFTNYSVESQKNMPGPGQYSPKNNIEADGNYFFSKFKSSMCRTFYHYDRNTLNITKS